MLPKAILLDLDDTIISFDYGIDLDGCWRSVCGKHLKVDGNELERMIGLIKQKAKWYWSEPERHRIGRLDLVKARIEIVSGALGETIIQGSGLAEQIATEYGLIRDEAVTLFPGAIETLQFFRDKGMKLALITNGSSQAQRKKIDRFGLASYFECILIEEEFGVGKPNQEVYMHAMEQLAVRADEAWMIGDNYEWEVAAPQKLGIRSVWINPKGAECPVDATPYMTIAALSEMKSYLQK
jgi:putative hydrolase of the HAD superfamily